MIVLLAGGSKKSQAGDIRKVKALTKTLEQGVADDQEHESQRTTPITSGVGAPQSFEPDPFVAFVVTLPLVGFFASGEIAHKHLYGYTGMLIVFT